jgi:hypothetical protein
MIMSDPVTLTALLFVAAGAGVVHTLAGPDHYVPLIAVGRAREWSPRRLACAATGLGLVHCLVSVVLVVSLMVFCEATIPAWLDGMAQIAAWTMIGAGAVFGVAAWRRRGNRSDPQRASRPAMTLLAMAFLVGPCEWLIPVALAAGQSHGVLGALQVSFVYTACTVATMATATLLGVFGLRRISRLRVWHAPVACIICGVLMLVGM